MGVGVLYKVQPRLLQEACCCSALVQYWSTNTCTVLCGVMEFAIHNLHIGLKKMIHKSDIHTGMDTTIVSHCALLQSGQTFR